MGNKMVDIKKYYLYCMGEGYLDKRRYSEDASHERATTRVFQDQQDKLYQSLLRQPPDTMRQQQLLQPFVPTTPLQQLMFTLLRPIQFMVVSTRELLTALLRKLTQQQQPLPGQQPQKGNVFERILAQVMGFFRPKSKDNPEERDKEQRFLEDFNDAEIWGRRVVEKPNGSGLGGGQR